MARFIVDLNGETLGVSRGGRVSPYGVLHAESKERALLDHLGVYLSPASASVAFRNLRNARPTLRGYVTAFPEASPGTAEDAQSSQVTAELEETLLAVHLARDAGLVTPTEPYLQKARLLIERTSSLV